MKKNVGIILSGPEEKIDRLIHEVEKTANRVGFMLRVYTIDKFKLFISRNPHFIRFWDPSRHRWIISDGGESKEVDRR